MPEQKKKMNVMKTRKGMTGLETAIILIAFVITAAAFSFVVLNMGFLSAQKTQTVIASGMKEASSSLQSDGDVIATFDVAGAAGELQTVDFYVRLSQGKEPIDIAADKLYVSITTKDEHLQLVAADYTIVTCDIVADVDGLIGPGERWSVNVEFATLGAPVMNYDTFRIELRPSTGSVLILERNVGAINKIVQVLE